MRRNLEPDDPDPYRIPCCESCAAWRRHPESGIGLCMKPMVDRVDMAVRDAALRAGNARNRCRHFIRLTTQEKTS